MTHVFPVLAILTMVAVLITYLRQVTQGSSIPNPVTWIIWAAVSVMNTVTYFDVVRGNLFEWVVSLVASGGLVSACTYFAIRGKFAMVGVTEIVCGVLTIMIGIFWRTTGNAVWANIFLQAIFLISFFPTVVGLLRGTLRERPLPWALSVVSYLFLVMAIIADWGEGSGYKLVYPIVNGVIGNGSVVATILWKRG